MAYIKDYWNDSRSRAERAKAWTAKMEKEFREAIARACKNTNCHTRTNNGKTVPDVQGNDEVTSSGRRRVLPQICILDAGVTDAIRAAASEASRQQNAAIAALNFASYKNPGGKFLEGSRAQEECLCHESFLYNVLRRFPGYYERNAERLNKALYENRALYTPSVCFFGQAGNSSSGNEVFCSISIITCAAPNKSAAQKYCNVSDEENHAALEDRIRFVLDIAEYHCVDTLILGAYGCGVFGQDPKEVATVFKKQLFLDDKNPRYGFRKVIFPIPYSEKDRNLETFRSVFETG